MITCDLAPESLVFTADELSFSVTVSDPDGDLVSLVLLNPPPGLVLDPLVDEPPPATTTARWIVGQRFAGRWELLFEARDASAPTVAVRLTVPFTVVGNANPSMVLTGDVTGDGVPDVVAVASEADLSVTDAGAIGVWSGATVPAGAPTATLSVPGASAGDRLGFPFNFGGQGLQLADLTGDGVLDVLAAAPLADHGGVVDAGALYLFAGGPSLVGSVAPTATLAVPGAAANDRLGSSAGQGVLLADVTGNGWLDVVACAQEADAGGVVDTGAVFVFAGGALAGSVAPTATLSVPGAVTGDRLGNVAGGILVADVTGDGILDVVAGSSSTDLGGVRDVGALRVFAGGLGLRGAVSPTATLAVPGATASDQLGFASVPVGVLIGDVTGDGDQDVVVGARFADVAGVVDTGAVYVFAGGRGLAGSVAPLATASVARAPGLQLGGISPQGRALHLVDVTADGVLDVVAAAPFADVGGVVDTGAVYVFAGGAGLLGAVGPGASLTVPGAATNDRLASVGVNLNVSILFADVSGDGLRDLIVGASAADVGGVTDAGAVHVFGGGPALAGAIRPLASLTVPGAVARDNLGLASGQAILVADVTADGVPDVIAAAQLADFGGVVGSGAVYLFAGGRGLSGAVAPTASLGASGSLSLAGSSGQGVLLGDVTGDGLLDLVVGSGDASGAGFSGGAVYVFAGSRALAGRPGPSATLAVLASTAGDWLGNLVGQGFQLADLDGDGVLDVVAGGWRVDVGGVSDTGAVYVFLGGSGLTGIVDASARLTVPGAIASDWLGGGSPGFFLADVTNDGLVDVLAGASRADVGGVVDAGAVYVFSTSSWAGSVPPASVLARPAARANDHLGGD